jgi:hypothetical protein
VARIRSVHPGLWTDEAFVGTSPLARLLLIGIWTECDDQGAFEWKPLTLKMRLLPLDVADMVALLGELTGNRLVARYSVGGKDYGAVRNFGLFQRPKKPQNKHPMPDQWRTFAGNAPSGSEPPPKDEERDDEAAEPLPENAPPVPHQFPTSGEKPPQMEDGGGRREEEKEESLAPLCDAQPIRELVVVPETAPNPRRSRIKPDWQPSARDREHARERGVSADDEAPRFRDFHTGRGSVMADWSAAWRTWVGNAVKFSQSGRGGSAPKGKLDWTPSVSHLFDEQPIEADGGPVIDGRIAA